MPALQICTSSSQQSILLPNVSNSTSRAIHTTQWVELIQQQKKHYCNNCNVVLQHTHACARTSLNVVWSILDFLHTLCVFLGVTIAKSICSNCKNPICLNWESICCPYPPRDANPSHTFLWRTAVYRQNTARPFCAAYYLTPLAETPTTYTYAYTSCLYTHNLYLYLYFIL